MPFEVLFTEPAEETYNELEAAATAAYNNRIQAGKTKSSNQEGLFKQVRKSIQYLAQNPKHPSLNTHEYDSIPNPINSDEKVFEAYAQNKTPGAYRVFWCYGPDKGVITIIAITPHP